MSQPGTGPLDRADLRARADKALREFLTAQQPRLGAIGDELSPMLEAVEAFVLDAGKRLRPAFAYWGWRAAGGPDSDGVVKAAASLELLHACALIHDDVMDGSDTRRGQPAVHRRFAALHRGSAWLGDPESFGTSAAILIGDMCLVWADQMLGESGLPPEALNRGQHVYDEMRAELMAGQYLDMLEQAVGGQQQTGQSVDRALRVARFKTAKYTVERPLHLGAALAGAPAEAEAVQINQALSGYGLPLGAAFQLRDDVLGVFGDPEQTGKPAGDDLREGKRTVLIAATLDRATPAQATLVRRHLGDPHLTVEGVAELRAVITETGALAQVEQLISDRLEESLAALAAAGFPAEPAEVLAELAVAATARRV
ncbi:MAG: geranylgeranyl diphosphate synthase, type [Frankiales bacterium]|nr:geranylgeranyl diphosphate synthase, type [Frankiales bacterium]